MLISEVYTRLADFLSLVTEDFGTTVIYADQNGPRPKKPFITLSLHTFKVLAMPIQSRIDEDGIQDLITSMSFVATIEAYSDQLHQAEELLNLVERYLRTNLAYLHFRGDMSYTRTLSGVSALPTFQGVVSESRATFDTEFLVNMLTKDNVGIIEHIVVTDMTTGSEIIVDI